jgi:hypothetical protein
MKEVLKIKHAVEVLSYFLCKKGYELHKSYVCFCCKDYWIVMACYSGETWMILSIQYSNSMEN